MKNLIFYVTLLMFFSSGCEDDNNPNDITAYNWKLISIKSGDEIIIVSEKSYVKEDAFILKFSNDSNFLLNTSINVAMGNFSIHQDNIELTKYQELTEVATNDSEQIQINDLLLEHLENVTEFSVNQDDLIFSSDNVEFIFKRM